MKVSLVVFEVLYGPKDNKGMQTNVYTLSDNAEKLNWGGKQGFRRLQLLETSVSDKPHVDGQNKI